MQKQQVFVDGVVAELAAEEQQQNIVDTVRRLLVEAVAAQQEREREEDALAFEAQQAAARAQAGQAGTALDAPWNK